MTAWPQHLVELGARWQAAPADRDHLRTQIWVLVHTALLGLVHGQASRYSSLGPEDAEDLAADKCADLMQRLDEGRWRPGETTPGQTCSFLNTIVRNGLVDLYRVEGSKRIRSVDVVDLADSLPAASTSEPKDRQHRDRYVAAIGECLDALTERSQRMWFFRVFLEMSSKEISAHPDVRTTPAAVDVALNRARSAIKTCMAAKKFSKSDMPAGTFAALWDRLNKS